MIKVPFETFISICLDASLHFSRPVSRVSRSAADRHRLNENEIYGNKRICIFGSSVVLNAGYYNPTTARQTNTPPSHPPSDS